MKFISSLSHNNIDNYEMIKMRTILDDELCEKLCEAAREKSLEMDLDISFAICDENGFLLVFIRYGEAPIFSTTLVPDKAYTSAIMFMPTEQLAKLTCDGGPLMGIQNKDSKITLVSGGFPLVVNGKCIGGIGIGGGRKNEDSIIGEYVLSIFNELTK